MNLQTIQENILELENSETTFDSVQELAYLYIIRNNFKSDAVEKEMSDILPAYEKYISAKKKYQLGETDDTCMIKYMELLCDEISEFLSALYSGTSTRKERKLLESIFPFI